MNIPYEWLSLAWVARYYGRRPSYMRAIQCEMRKSPGRRNYVKVPEETLRHYPAMTKRGKEWQIHGSELAAFEAAQMKGQRHGKATFRNR